MTDKQTPPDWVLIEAAKRSGWEVFDLFTLRNKYVASGGGTYRALCDMIELHEEPPVDRKVLCAREALMEMQTEAAKGLPYTVTAEHVAVRAIELYEKGFGK